MGQTTTGWAQSDLAQFVLFIVWLDLSKFGVNILLVPQDHVQVLSLPKIIDSIWSGLNEIKLKELQTNVGYFTKSQMASCT